MEEYEIKAPPYTVSDRAMRCMVDIAAAGFSRGARRTRGYFSLPPCCLQ